jgi:hypothetical protein
MPSPLVESMRLPVEAARQAMPSQELEPKLHDSEGVAEPPKLQKCPKGLKISRYSGLLKGLRTNSCQCDPRSHLQGRPSKPCHLKSSSASSG